MRLCLARAIATAILIGSVAGTDHAQNTVAPSAEARAHAHDVADLIDAAHEQCDIALEAVSTVRKVVMAAKKAKTVEDMSAELQSLEASVLETAQHLGSCDDVLKLAAQAQAASAAHDVHASP